MLSVGLAAKLLAYLVGCFHVCADQPQRIVARSRYASRSNGFYTQLQFSQF